MGASVAEEPINGLAGSIARMNGITSGRDGSMSSHFAATEIVTDRYWFTWHLGFDEDQEWVPRSNLEGAHSLAIGNNATDRAQLLNLAASQYYVAAGRIRASMRIVIIVPSHSHIRSIKLNRSADGIEMVQQDTLSGSEYLMEMLDEMYGLLSKPGGNVRPLYLIHDIDSYELNHQELSRVHQRLGVIANRGSSTLNFNLIMSTSRADALPDKVVTQMNLIALTLSSSDDSWAILGETGMESAPRKIGASERDGGVKVFKMPASIHAGGFSQINASITRR